MIVANKTATGKLADMRAIASYDLPWISHGAPSKSSCMRNNITDRSCEFHSILSAIHWTNVTKRITANVTCRTRYDIIFVAHFVRSPPIFDKE